MSQVTMSQVAEFAGVSQSTVSFVLNGRERKNGSISKETRLKVTEAAKQLGYRPNWSARSLATGRTNLIGLCMWNLAFSRYSSIIGQAESQIRDTPYHLIVSRWKSNAKEIDAQTMQGVFTWPLDGVLALEAAPVLLEHWEKFSSWPTPMVSMGGTDYQVNNLDYVGIDLTVGLNKAVEHLLEKGCQRIAYATNLGSPQHTTDSRYDLFKQMNLHGKSAEYILISRQEREFAREEFKQYVAQHGCPDGLICVNDEMALGIYRALYELGIKVGRNVALIGCDGIQETSYLEVPLTTVVQPVEEMCRLAWEILQKRIENPGMEFQRIVLLPELAIRESTVFFNSPKSK